MKYRNDKNNTAISQLGYGCMRFSKNGNKVDMDKTEKEIMAAIDMGINYYDTAYIYPGIEEALGTILEKNKARDKVYIATKLPQYTMRSREQIDKTFAEELKRLKTDYIDYYLMHMFTAYSEWENLKKLGIENWIEKHKADGSIRNIGFSYHGNTEEFIKILNVYDWEFCQIQYNYLDETSQAGRKGLEAAYEKGIPVIIMEPLRGGKLVNLPDKAKQVIKDNGRDYSCAELALRWLWDQPGVTCVLSGMNSMEMLKENVRIASDADVGCFDETDFKIVKEVIKIIREREKVGCTGCRYCMPCPKGVDIPAAFYFYNLMYMENKHDGRFGYAQSVGLRGEKAFPSQCIQCGKCEMHCPQHIAIREKLKEADKELRPLPYRVGIELARKFFFKR